MMTTRADDCLGSHKLRNVVHNKISLVVTEFGDEATTTRNGGIWLRTVGAMLKFVFGGLQIRSDCYVKLLARHEGGVTQMNIRQMTIEQMALVIGFVLGSAIFVVVGAAFFLGHAFGLGGVTLTLAGLVLTGPSIWHLIRIRVSPEGGFEATFERLQKEVTSLRNDTKGVTNELTEFKGKIRTSLLESASPETLEELRRSEKVDQLIERGKLEEALKLDPGNTIALMNLIERLAKKGQFRQASELYPELKQANESGVGYSVYPQLALAFDKEGNVSQAQSILSELEEAIQTDIARGYGYLSRSQQIGWVLRDIQVVSKKVKNAIVAERLQELITSLKSTIDALRKG